MRHTPAKQAFFILTIGLSLIFLTSGTLAKPCDDSDRSKLFSELNQTNADYIYQRPSGDKPSQDLYQPFWKTGNKAIAKALAYLRDLALTKAHPLPKEIKQKLGPYFAPDLLDKARYATDWNTSIGAVLRQLLDTDRYAMAVTLDYVIVFGDRQSLENLWLWIHELKHVEQYDRWGVETFTGNYLLDHLKVEQEANDYAARVMRKIRNSKRGHEPSDTKE